MIIRRQLLQAVLQAVNADDATHRTDKIQITPSGDVVATTGTILLVAREATRFPDTEFPQKDVPTYHGDPPTAITITKPIAERVIKGTAKKGMFPILQAVQLGQNGEGTYIAATDLESPTVVRIEPQDKQPGSFPAWERVLPSDKHPAIRVTIAADILQAIAKATNAVSKASYNHCPQVTFYIPTEPQHQGLDKKAALADGGTEQRTIGGTEIFAKHGKLACARDYPNGHLQSAIRIEIDGTDGVTIIGAVALCRRPD